MAKKLTWYETHRRNSYQASWDPGCDLYIGPVSAVWRGKRWEWRVGRGDLVPRSDIEPVKGIVLARGGTETRAGAKRAAIAAAKQVCKRPR